MTRFLCLTLLSLIALPAFAQDEPTALGQALPPDPAFLMRERERLNFAYRETQRVLSFINPNDTQLVEDLRNRQAELARRMSDIARQLQTLSTPPIGEMLPGMDPRQPAIGMPGMPMPTDTPGLPPPPSRQDYSVPPVIPGPAPGLQNAMPVTPTPMPGMVGGMGGYYPPTMSTLPNMATPNIAMSNNPLEMQNLPYWGNPAHAWNNVPLGSRLPQELTGVKQSVDSLQKEIADLKETIRRLETQIQLLSQTVLRSVPERTNERVVERVRDNEE
ncbi:MAG: hypothetical protein FWE95_05870 [Planctomycetaceae bacterium]|nr:hypothetical protein [Planctomycetaceae bacterium]